MLSDVRFKKPVDSSLAKTAISVGGIGLIAPRLAKRFETHLSKIISDSKLLLKTAVENKVAMVRPAHIRDRNRLGRIFNQIFRVDSKYIELSGAELSAAIKLANEETEEAIFPECTYLVPIEEAERMLVKLKC